MRFRLSHILLLMVLVAFFSFLIPSGSYIGYTLVNSFTWLGCGVLAIRALVRPGRERLIILSGLVLGLSYYICVTFIFAGSHFPTSWFLMLDERFSHAVDPSHSRASAVRTGEYAFAYLFGFIGAWIAAYWTRSENTGPSIG